VIEISREHLLPIAEHLLSLLLCDWSTREPLPVALFTLLHQSSLSPEQELQWVFALVAFPTLERLTHVAEDTGDWCEKRRIEIKCWSARAVDLRWAEWSSVHSGVGECPL
jgi:hypothetical protein